MPLHSTRVLRHSLSFLLLFALHRLQSPAQTPAFPGALGFGANATGGRYGSVYHVTTLADSGPGSFRDAVSKANRIVVFDVGGYVTLNSGVSVRENITIAGQTAPGGGIGFKGDEISFGSRNNIICRHIRVRPGSETDSNNDVGISLYRARNVILDHISIEFAPWNNVGAVSDDWQNWPVTDVTFQHCLNANPTYQQFGAHTESVQSRMAWFYSIFANSHNRNPMSKINDLFINNVLYNCSAGYTTHTSTSFDHDVVNNYFIAGPASSGSNFPWYQIDPDQSIYYSGNYYDSDKNGVLGGGPTAVSWYNGVGTILSSPWSSLTATSVLYSAQNAYRIAISQAGAWPRDSMDDLVISQIKTLGNGPVGTGSGTAGPDGGLYTSQTQTGLPNNGYGIINGGVPPIDTDNDGMPDYWEKADAGLDFTSNDAMNIGSDGYANIEHYLNWLAEPHALTVTNTPIDIDLWRYTSGFTNVSPVYSVTSLSNCTVSLNDGHIAKFIPLADIAGMGAFQFAVSGSDGTAHTNVCTVVISPLTPPSNLVWRGDGSANLWGNGDGANWSNGSELVAFNSGDNVTFDDTGSNAPAIALSGFLPAGVVYVLADQDYTFGGSGAISGGASLFKTGNGALFLYTTNTFTGGTTINDGIIQVGDGISANGNLGGNITNNDSLIFANPAPLTSSASISGAGAFTKHGAGTLTLTGNQTYTNLTTINAGALELAGTPPTGDITNNGTLTLKPSGLVKLPGKITGPGGLILNSSGNTVYVTGDNAYSGGTTVLGGNLVLSNNTAAGTGPVTYNAVSGSVMVGGGMVITNDFSVAGSSFTDLMMQGTNGTGIWAGDVVNLGSGAQFRPGADSGGALMFTGNAQLGGRYLIVPRGSVTFASNAVITTTQTGCALGRDGSGGNRSANVTIRDSASLNLGGCNFGGNLAGGNVTVTLQNSAALNIGGSNLDLNNVNRSTAQTFLRLNGGTLTVGGFTKTKSAQTNTIQFNGGLVKAGANNSSFLPALNSSSNWVQTGGARIDDGGFNITITASLFHDPGLGAGADGGLVKSGGGTLTLTGSNTYNGALAINAGTVALAGAGRIPFTTNMSIAAGATLDVRQYIDNGAIKLNPGQAVSGNGMIRGGCIVGSNARLLPGSEAIGSLTISNLTGLASALTLERDAISIFEISHAPLTNDTIHVIGRVALGGTLIVTNVGGTVLARGDSFKLFAATTYSGTFATVVLPALPVGLAWETEQLESAGIISVVSEASPTFTSLSLHGHELVSAGSNGVANGIYFVLTSTNVALPVSEWTRIATNQFNEAGGFAFTNATDGFAPAGYFRLELP